LQRGASLRNKLNKGIHGEGIMFQSIASYIWGEEEEYEEIPEYLTGTHVEVENEWILVPKDNEDNETKEDEDEDTDTQTIRTDIHIECTLRHPDEENAVESAATTMEEEVEEEDLRLGLGELLEIVKEDAKKVGDCAVVPKRIPLRDLNGKVALSSKRDNGKHLKRHNRVYTRVNSTRKNKQYGRMEGKHVGMVGKRGK